MKEKLPINIPLYVIAVTLLLFTFRSFVQPPSVFSETGITYSYLQPQAGEATESGSKRFIDMRNGASWVCNWHHCVLEGQFPLQDIKLTNDH
jgi:hypothetical protein